MDKLNEKERKKLEVTKKVISNEITQIQGANILKLSDRQMRRLVYLYKIEGDDGFMHKNRGKENKNKTSKDVMTEIINLYLTEYSDFNFTHFYEECGETFGISYSQMCAIFKENDIISPLAQHRTVKLYYLKMENAIKENNILKEKKELYEERKQEEFEKHIRKSILKYSFGEEVQMDAAFWIWFGNEETALHLAVDKATKKVLYGWFDYQETTETYMIILMNIILNYGIPKTIKTDKRSSFSVNNAKSSKTNLNLTQFGRICEDLEINLRCSSDPLFKPNVERENSTFKSRLTAELRHNNITTIDKANEYLVNVFIPKMNSRFSYGINPNKNVIRKNTYSKEELNIIISTRFIRTIDNASSFKYENDYYMPVDLVTNKVVSFKKGTKCKVIIAFDKNLFCLVEDKLYSMQIIEKPEPIQKYQDFKKTPAYKGHKSAPDHPWRKGFKKI